MPRRFAGSRKPDDMCTAGRERSKRLESDAGVATCDQYRAPRQVEACQNIVRRRAGTKGNCINHVYHRTLLANDSQRLYTSAWLATICCSESIRHFAPCGSEQSCNGAIGPHGGVPRGSDACAATSDGRSGFRVPARVDLSRICKSPATTMWRTLRSRTRSGNRPFVDTSFQDRRFEWDALLQRRRRVIDGRPAESQARRMAHRPLGSDGEMAANPRHRAARSAHRNRPSGMKRHVE